MLHHPRIHPQMAYPVPGSLEAVIADVRHAAGNGVHTIPALCAVLMQRIGNPNLEDVILAVREIDSAKEPSAHWAAAAELAKAATDICGQNHIEF